MRTDNRKVFKKTMKKFDAKFEIPGGWDDFFVKIAKTAIKESQSMEDSIAHEISIKGFKEKNQKPSQPKKLTLFDEYISITSKIVNDLMHKRFHQISKTYFQEGLVLDPFEREKFENNLNGFYDVLGIFLSKIDSTNERKAINE